MTTREINDKIKFMLPAGFIFSRDEDDEGNEVVHILAGEYINDEGETHYKFDCRIGYCEYTLDDVDEDCTSSTLLDSLAKRMPDSRRMKLPGSPRMILLNKAMPLSIFGRIIKMYASIGLIQVSDWSALQLVTAGTFNDDDPKENSERYEFIYEVLKATRINGKKLPVDTVSPSQIEEALQLTFEENGDSIDVSPKIQFNFTNGDETTTYEYTTDGMKEVGKEYLTRVTPDMDLYPHYNSVRSAGNLGFLGATVVVNASGTEYEFIPFRKAAENDEAAEDMRALYNRVIAKDTEHYDLYEKAGEMRKLFHVSKTAFDPRHDRECELKEGYMHRAYMMSGLRSFAWTLADYCKQHGCTPDDIDNTIASRIANFVANEDWLNYDGDTYCQGLCSGSDLHVYFVPDGVTQADREKLLPSQEDRDRVKKMKAKFPTYREILSEVHSLNALREDLAYVYPAVKTLWDSLEESRDYDEALLGNEADIVYAWCALALAAKEPFFTEDGPMTCFFSQPAEEGNYSSDRPERIGTVRNSAVDEAATKEWLKKYEQYVDKSPEIEFNGKLFVFSGLMGHGQEKDHPIVQKVMEKGGQYRSKVSGLTNYLVVDPREAGSSKIEAVLEQHKKGKIIKVILLEDLENVQGKNGTSIKKGSTVESKKLSVVPDGPPASPDSDFERDYLNHATVTDYLGTEDNVVIPYDVTIIGEYAFQMKEIKSVFIPEGVIELKNDAFYGCKELTSVQLPSTLTKIGAEAFQDCVSLTSITIPEGVTELKDSLFSWCDALESVQLPSTLKQIGRDVFFGCGWLEALDIPNGVEEVGEKAFCNCTMLKEVKLPTTLKRIDGEAFTNCHSLTAIIIPASVVHIGEACFSGCEDLVVFLEKGSTAEQYCVDNNIAFEYIGKSQETVACDDSDFLIQSSGTLVKYIGNKAEVIIPEKVTSIGESVFEKHTELERIVVPDSVKEIGNYAFYGCSNMQEITLGNSITRIGDRAFWHCDKLTSIEIPDSITEIGESAFAFCEELQEVTIGSGVTTIGREAFTFCTNLQKVFIGKNVNVLGEKVFSCCYNVIVYLEKGSVAEQYCMDNEIRFEYNTSTQTDMHCSTPEFIVNSKGCLVKYIGNVSEIVIPEGIESISSSVFMEHPEVVRVVLPCSLHEIRDDLFNECSNIQEIILNNGITKIGIAAFASCKNITRIIVPSSVTEIGECAFSECEKLNCVTIPTSVTKIGDDAFDWCPQLVVHLDKGSAAEKYCLEKHIKYEYNELSKGESISCAPEFLCDSTGCLVKYIGNSPEVAIPEGVSSIDSSVFKDHTELTRVVLPDSITEISPSLFNECTNLQQIVLGQHTEIIKSFAFYLCTSLTEIAIPESVIEIEEYAFNGCTSLQEISLGGRIAKIGDCAFTGCSNLSSINIPGSVIEIGTEAFSECENLTRVILPENLIEIADSAFLACENLCSICIPASVTKIGEYVFDDCPQLVVQLIKCNLRSPTATGAVVNGHSAVRQRPA